MRIAEIRPMLSLKKRLITMTVTAATVLIAISWSLIFAESKHEIDEIFDARLGQSAKLLALSAPQLLKMPPNQLEQFYEQWYQGITNHAGRDDDDPTPYGHPYEQKLMFQLLSADGKVMLRSPAAPPTPLSAPDKIGYHPLSFDDQRWRSFQIRLPLTEQNQEAAFLIVAEKEAIRDELIDEIAFSTGVPQLLLIPCLALAIILLVNYIMQPVGELQQALSRRTINKLHAIQVSQPTIELKPLIDQLNYLLSELDKAWIREKRFTHTAAHELKTPLAVLRLNAENALASDNPQDLQNDLTHILKGIERTDRLIQQLLMLARVEGVNTFSFSETDLMACLRDVIGSLVPLALKQDQNLSLDGPDSLIMDANGILMACLFSNLIDNAIRYAGSNADINISVSLSSDDWVAIRVCDTGQPIPDAIRERIFEKFFRANTERGDGAGLGMSIIRDIAALHGGDIVLERLQADPRNCFLVTLPVHHTSTSSYAHKQ